ncbi:hypothetical protein ABNF65_12910 [Paenibacillus larvae]
MFEAIADGFKYLFSWLGDLFTFLLEGIQSLISPFLELFKIIFYVIYMLGLIIVKIVKLVFMVAKLLIGLVQGLFATILGFSYSGGGSGIPGAYTEPISHIQPFLGKLQLDKIAYLMQFAIWFSTAFLAIKIIGSMRSGGND